MEPFPFLKNRLKPGVYIRQDLYIQPKLIYRTSCDEVLNAFEFVVKMATTFAHLLAGLELLGQPPWP